MSAADAGAGAGATPPVPAAGAGAGASPPEKPHGISSEWKRRLVVALMYVVSITLLVLHFLVVAPGAEEWKLRIDAEIPKLNTDELAKQKDLLASDYASYLRQNAVDRAVLVAAAVISIAAVLTGGIWGFVDAHRSGAKA
jgi:hypothetical protein